MINKNLDGIKKQNISRLRKPVAKIVQVDGVVKRANIAGGRRTSRPVILSQVHPTQTGRIFGTSFFRTFYSRQKLPVMAAALALFLTFSGGMWFALNTARSRAEATVQPEVLADSVNTPPHEIPLPGAELPAASTVSNDILFNTPIEYLKNYLAAVSEPDIIAHRKDQITVYLNSKKSPFAEASETIAAQPHWQLILAIAFAESSWGRNCSDNNCSNIGVKPGHAAWREYPSYSAWVADFNRLLEKRYKDWTLEEMCGVYVKPCNPNWLAATKQVLGELKEQGIE